jgi:hypothetical protein
MKRKDLKRIEMKNMGKAIEDALDAKIQNFL